MKIGIEKKCGKDGKFIQKHQMASAICECVNESDKTEDCVKDRIAAFCNKEKNLTLFGCKYLEKCKDTKSSEAARMECLKEFCGDDEYKKYHHTFQCRKIK